MPGSHSPAETPSLPAAETSGPTGSHGPHSPTACRQHDGLWDSSFFLYFDIRQTLQPKKMTKFLTLKHWQLFMLLIGIPMILEFLLMGFLATTRDPRIIFIFFPIMMIIFGGLFFAWFYSLGTNLFKKLPETARMSLTRFKLFMFIPVAYILVILLFMYGNFLNIASGGQPNPGIFALIIPVHLFSMFCLFYCLYFIAKALKTVEWQKPVTFGDYAGEFFLLWFFPVGVWILQPRINRLFAAPEVIV
jgi:hypothetical protein